MTYAAMALGINFFGPEYVAIAHTGSPYVSAYPWDKGFGTRYANPPSAVGVDGSGIAFKKAKNVIGISSVATPFIQAFPWNPGFGTKYSNPSPAISALSSGGSVAWHPEGNAIALGNTSRSPYVHIWPWTDSSGFGTQYSSPATGPTGSGEEVTFTNQGTTVAVAHFVTPFVSAYPWSVSGFGTKYSNPSPLPGSSGRTVSFTPSGNTIAIGSTGAGPNYANVYPWGPGFGTRYTNPSPTVGTNFDCAFSPQEDTIVFAGGSIFAYAWSVSGFGSKFADPVTLPAGQSNGVAFSFTGDTIGFAHITTPFVSAYPWSSSGFGTKYANPVSLPNGSGESISFA